MTTPHQPSSFPSDGGRPARARHAAPRRKGARLFTPVVIMAIAIVLTSGSVAAAYISSSSSGTYGASQAGTLTGTTSLTAVTVTTSTVKLTWTAPTEPSGATITKWTITQTLGSSTATSACYKTSPAPKCSVTGLSASSTYKWKLTYYVHTWTTHTTSSVVSTTGVVVTPTTVYTTYGKTGLSEASCGATGVVVGGGGFYGTNTFKAAHPYVTGPVTAAILATPVTLASTSFKFKTGGLPFGVTANDTLLVGTAGNLDTFKVNTTTAQGATTLAVKTGTNTSGTSTVAAGNYVFDVTATAWRPPTTGAATGPTSYGWFTTSTLTTATAYVLCVPKTKFVPTTVYAAIQNVTPTFTATGLGVAEASCPAGDVITNGGYYAGVLTGAAHQYFSSPVTTATLATGITAGSTSLTLTAAGLPFAVSANDFLLVGPPGNLDRFKVKTAASAGATTVAVKTEHTLSGGGTVAAGAYVFDLTSATWRPATTSAGTAKTSTGWLSISTEAGTRKVTSYAVCVPATKVTEKTVYEATQNLTANVSNTAKAGIAEVSCPVGYQPLGGGFYAGALSGAAHPYYSGPVSAALLAAQVTPSSSTLTLKSPGIPAAMAATDSILVGSPDNLERFKVKTAASAGATTVAVKTGTNFAGSSVASAYSYAYDITSLAWRPPNAGTGLYGTPYGWFTLSTEITLHMTTAYAVCVASNPPTKSAPGITSANTTTFIVGQAGSFNMTATGYPVVTYSKSGSLPSGVTFTTTTGQLSGTPASGTAGTYVITITASNGVSPNASQSFTLKVNPAPPTATQVGAVTQKTGGATKTFTSASVTITSGDAYLIFAARSPDSADSVTTITSTGFTTSPTITAIAAKKYNTTAAEQWAYYATGGSGTGKFKITFTKANNASPGNKQTFVDVVHLAGQGTPPIVTTSEGFSTGSSTTVNAKLASTPASSDGEIVFYSVQGTAAGSAPASTPAGLSNLAYTKHANGTIGVYFTQTASTTTYKFTIANKPWGAMALEVKHA